MDKEHARRAEAGVTSSLPTRCSGRQYEMEARKGDLRSVIRADCAVSWPAGAEHSPSYSPHALTQGETRGVATSTNRGPRFTATLSHFILATTIRLG